MQPLDGNAIAGALRDAFGNEMTSADGTCAHCGNTSELARLVVYAAGPGMVARCRSCAGVVIVVVEIRGATEVHRLGLQSIAVA